jgi:hypothetical protein
VVVSVAVVVAETILIDVIMVLLTVFGTDTELETILTVAPVVVTELLTVPVGEIGSETVSVMVVVPVLMIVTILLLEIVPVVGETVLLVVLLTLTLIGDSVTVADVLDPVGWDVVCEVEIFSDGGQGARLVMVMDSLESSGSDCPLTQVQMGANIVGSRFTAMNSTPDRRTTSLACTESLYQYQVNSRYNKFYLPRDIVTPKFMA